MNSGIHEVEGYSLIIPMSVFGGSYQAIIEKIGTGEERRNSRGDCQDFELI